MGPILEKKAKDLKNNKTVLSIALGVIVLLSIVIVLNNIDITGLAIRSSGSSSKAACNDKVDNDFDGKIDYAGYRKTPKDPDCSSYTDDTECSVACATNANCGISGWGSSYCFNGNVYADYASKNCINPNTCSAYCAQTTTPSLLQTCQFGCSNGTCNLAPTNSCGDSDGGIVIGLKGTTSGYLNGLQYSHSDFCSDSASVNEYYCSGASEQREQSNCGTDSYGQLYCMNSSVYSDFTDYSCNNGACRSIVTSTFVEGCSYGCTDGICNSGETKVCGDNVCDAPYETSANCAVDCAVTGSNEIFSKVTTIETGGAKTILTKPLGIDIDNDAKLELVTRPYVGEWVTSFNIYENTVDNSFSKVHTISIPGYSSGYPSDIGDSDNDGLKELLMYGRTGNEFYVRIYESNNSNSYPSNKVWETATGWWTVGARIDDLDNDGKKEIAFGGQDFNYLHKIQVFENNGDNSFSRVYSTDVPNVHTSQRFEVMDDLDGNGKKEMVFCGLVPDSTVLHMYESSGDNLFSEIFAYDFKRDNNGTINCNTLKFVGDSDGDGKKEFIVGGLGGDLFTGGWKALYFLFEANGDNTFKIISKFEKQPLDAFGDTTAYYGDLDNDGKNEIIITSEYISAPYTMQSSVYVFKSTGDNAFSEIWKQTWTEPHTTVLDLSTIGVGDLDKDGKAEITFNEYDGQSVKISVYEYI